MCENVVTLVLVLNSLTPYFMFLLCKETKKPKLVSLLLIITYNTPLFLFLPTIRPYLLVLVSSIMVIQIVLIYIARLDLVKVGAFSSIAYFLLLLCHIMA